MMMNDDEKKNFNNASPEKERHEKRRLNALKIKNTMETQKNP